MIAGLVHDRGADANQLLHRDGAHRDIGQLDQTRVTGDDAVAGGEKLDRDRAVRGQDVGAKAEARTT